MAPKENGIDRVVEGAEIDSRVTYDPIHLSTRAGDVAVEAPGNSVQYSAHLPSTRKWEFVR